MNSKHFLIAVACLLLSFFSVSAANVLLKTVTLSPTAYSNTNFSSSNIASAATSVTMKVTGANYVKFLYYQNWQEGKTIYVREWDNSKAEASYSTSDPTILADIRSGKIAYNIGFNDGQATLTIYSYGPEGSEDNGGGTGDKTDDDNNNTDNDDNTKTDEDDNNEGSSLTLQEKISQKLQITNIPTIYLTVPDAIGKDINSVLFKTGKDAEYHAATIQVVDKSGKLEEFTDDKLEIKVRGNSTAGDSKKPYRLKFGKDKKDAAGNVIETHKHDMIGGGYKKRNWTLLTNQKDLSLIQNAITYHVGQAVGMEFCPGYMFVDLVINDQYRGNYQVSDHCEVGSHRIDVDEDTGWFVESARGDMVEEPSVQSAGLGITIKNPEPDTEAGISALKTEVKAYFDKLNYFWGVYGTPCSDEEFWNPYTGWRAYIDEESLVNFYVGINLTDDYDGFMTVKMYREADGKLKFGPLWDKDLAYGNWGTHGDLCEEYQKGYTFSDHIQRMMTDPYFVKAVHDKLEKVLANKFETTISNAITEISSTISQSFLLDKQYMNNVGQDQKAKTERLRQYIKDRCTFLQNEIDKKYYAMGCDKLIPLEELYPGPGTGGSGSHVCPYQTTIGEWQNIPLPSSAIHPQATAAHLKVVGTSFFRLLTDNDENKYIEQYSFSHNGANMSGREFDITDEETLTKMKAGSLYLRCGGGSATVTITCTVPESTDPVPDPQPTQQQLTNLPTLYLTAAEIGSSWKTASLQIFDKDNKLYQGTEWSTNEVEVQYQGSGTAGSKNSYRLKFGTATQLLASGTFKQWVLASNDDDPTLINNALAKVMGDQLGLPFTPGYQYVDLYVNNVYAGTYMVTDRIKAEAGRALVSGGKKSKDWHIRLNDQTEYKEDQLAVSIAGTSATPYIILKNPDPDDLSDADLKALMYSMSDYFQYSVFAKTNGHYANLADNVDKQQLIQWYIAQEVLGVYKGFSSIEAYRSVTATDQKFHLGLLWDNEKSLGNPGEAPAINMTDLNTKGSHKGLMIEYAAYDVMKDVFKDLWQEAWFANGVKALWDEKKATLLSELKSKATSLSQELSASQAKNASTWTGSLGNYDSYQASIEALKSHLDNRFAYLTAKFTELAAALPCETHTYTGNEYAEQSDHTYRRACDVCGLAENNGQTYYQFLVYTDSKKDPQTVYTADKTWPTNQDVSAQPNTLFVTQASGIEGTNVVSAGVCTKLVLTDGFPFYNPADFKAQEATYTRTVKAENRWGTVCLPFRSVENEDIRYYHLSDISTEEQTGTMMLETATKTGGNTPLIFRKRSADATLLTFTGEAKDDTGITVKESKDMEDNASSEKPDGWFFYGNVKKPQTVKATKDPNAYYIAEDQFWHVTSQVTIPAFRAYFTSTAPVTAVRFRLSTDDDTNGIEELTYDILAPEIYDLNGRLVRQDKLKTGVYIINGTKTFIQ